MGASAREGKSPAIPTSDASGIVTIPCGGKLNGDAPPRHVEQCSEAGRDQMNDTEYVIVIEPAADGSFSAYVPDLLGCVSCGDTLDELRGNIAEAVQAHIEALR